MSITCTTKIMNVLSTAFFFLNHWVKSWHPFCPINMLSSWNTVFKAEMPCPFKTGKDIEWKGKADSKNQENSLRNAQFHTSYVIRSSFGKGCLCRGKTRPVRTKSKIPMICLAKRANEKWIKASRDQRKSAEKSTWLPWEQQEMHIIF